MAVEKGQDAWLTKLRDRFESVFPVMKQQSTSSSFHSPWKTKNKTGNENEFSAWVSYDF